MSSIQSHKRPILDLEQNKKQDELAKKKGLAIGTAALLEFRQFVSSHSVTYALGPMTAEEIVKDAEKRDWRRPSGTFTGRACRGIGLRGARGPNLTREWRCG